MASLAHDWRKPGVDTTQIMAETRAAIAANGAHLQLVSSHGGHIKRRVDESLLDFDAMREHMLPFCIEPYGHNVRKLAKLSILFMQTKHFKDAVALGWTAVDFWGLSKRSMLDAKPRGLLPTLAWSHYKGKLRGIDREGAKVATLRADGSVNSMLSFRPHPCPGTVPFWESEGLGS